MIAVAAPGQMFNPQGKPPFPELTGWGSLVCAVDLASRLAVPAGVLGVLHGQAAVAVGSAALITAFAVLRGLLAGRGIEHALTGLWREIIEAARRRTVVDLRSRDSRWNVWTLTAACHQLAELRASALPRLWADCLGLAVLAFVVVVRLGVAWLAAGAAVLLLVVAVMLPLRGRFRQFEERSQLELSELGLDLDVLLEAPAELRAQGREQAFARGMGSRVAALASAQRRASTYSSMVGLLPLAAALGALAFSGARLGLDATTLAEAGVLGAAGLVFGLGVLRGAEALARSSPQRELVASFLEHAASPDRRSGSRPNWRGTIELRAISVVYPGAAVATPADVNLVWSSPGGLAVMGDNGSGKTTLALVLLGLLPPTSGEMLIGGKPVEGCASSTTVAYVPQNAYLSPTRSVGWHLRLSDDTASAEDLLRALRIVGLEEVLRKHACDDPLEVRAGALSGGERRRLHLARAFLTEPMDLVVLDEPEAGIDQASRPLLRELLGRLAGRARVIVIVQDPNIVPESFVRLTCVRGQAR